MRWSQLKIEKHTADIFWLRLFHRLLFGLRLKATLASYHTSMIFLYIGTFDAGKGVSTSPSSSLLLRYAPSPSMVPKPVYKRGPVEVI